MTRWIVQRHESNADNEVLQTIIVYPYNTTTTEIMLDNKYKSYDRELIDIGG